jgi:hypothetical protein
MKRSISLATLLLFGTLPLVAFSQYQPPDKPAPAADTVPPLFKKLDLNHDGYLTREEARYSAEVAARFADLDSDHDGRISIREFTDGMQPKEAKHVQVR